MNKNKPILMVSLSTLLFTSLFYRHTLGINVLIYELAICIGLLMAERFRMKEPMQRITGVGFLLTMIFSVATNSAYSLFCNFLALFLFTGVLIYPKVRSLINAFKLSFHNLFLAQIKFLTSPLGESRGSLNPEIYFKRLAVFVIPLFIIILFTSMYRWSNPVFNSLVVNLILHIQKEWQWILHNIDLLFFITLFFGLVISNSIWMRTSNTSVIQEDKAARDQMNRLKNKNLNHRGFTGFMNEYHAAFYLLLMLNTILLIVNSIDIYWVWFHFEWNGQYLKQFVHTGTYLLIISILVAIAIVLYYFRGNLNFYSRNQWLKYMCYVWLIQNSILAVSVGIRNFWYIHYFALAYKRIGVIIFLLATLYGIITVLIKIRKQKSTFYLLRTNALFMFVLLILSSGINWDQLIVRYNFQHAETAFLHLDYLATLSDQSLPELDKSLAELQRLDIIQKGLFPFEKKYMTPGQYCYIIDDRIRRFKTKWESQSILSWNLPDFLAYRKLKDWPTVPGITGEPVAEIPGKEK